MATYYCLLSKRTNGDGTSGNPWQPSQISLANNDTLILSGTGAGDAVIPTFTSLSDITITGDNCVIDGAETVTGSWTQSGSPNTSVYTATISGTVGAVTYNYGPNGDGRNLGFLTNVADAAACQAAANSYYVSGTTLGVNVGASPAANSVAILRAGPGLRFTSCSGVTVNGTGTIRRWASGAGTTGRGITLGTSLDNFTGTGSWTVVDNSHGQIGTVTVGVDVPNLLIEGWTFGGIGTGGRGHFPITTSGAFTNGRIRNCTFYVCSWLSPSGSRVAAANSINASGVTLQEAAGTSTFVIEGCTFQHFANDLSLPFRFVSGSGFATAPTGSDRNNWANFGARAVRCRVLNGNTIYGDTNWSMYQCYIDVSRAQADGTLTQPVDLGSAAIMNLTSCVFVGSRATTNVASGAGTYEPFHIAGGFNADVRAFACTFVDVSTSPSSVALWDVGDSGAATFTAQNCIFARTATGVGFTSASSFNLTYYDLDGNAYIGVTTYSSNTTYDSFAEWFASVDPTAVQDATAALFDPEYRLINSPAVTGRKQLNATIAGARVQGIDGADFSGMYGAFQASGSFRTRKYRTRNHR